MYFSFEILIVIFLTAIHSVFGIGLLLFGTPTFLLLGYDFPNTINILVPLSIVISLFQFLRSKKKEKKFILNYNLFCLPFLVLFLILALNFKDIIDFKLYVSILLILFSFIILNKKKFYLFDMAMFRLNKIFLILIGSIHGFTNMGGSFLSVYSTVISKNNKELSRYYISYGYLIMGIIQYVIVIIFSFDHINFSKIYYILIALLIYFPSQILFKNISEKFFSKVINILALIYGITILSYGFIG